MVWVIVCMRVGAPTAGQGTILLYAAAERSVSLVTVEGRWLFVGCADKKLDLHCLCTSVLGICKGIRKGVRKKRVQCLAQRRINGNRCS